MLNVVKICQQGCSLKCILITYFAFNVKSPECKINSLARCCRGPCAVKNTHDKVGDTECFTDLGKLNFPTVDF